jgi:hypothetical protein
MTRMGRHAAPSDDEPDSEAADAVTERLPSSADVLVEPRPAGSRPLPGPRGRHSHPDDDDDESGADAAGSVTAQEHLRRGATAADLRLLRSDPSLRNRVIAAVLVPFVLYFVILLAIGRTGAFAVWVWLPLISAGIGGGLLLDAAHAKAKKKT